MKNTIALFFVSVILGIVGCSKGAKTDDKPSPKMDIPQGLPGGAPGDAQIPKTTPMP